MSSIPINLIISYLVTLFDFGLILYALFDFSSSEFLYLSVSTTIKFTIQSVQNCSKYSKGVLTSSHSHETSCGSSGNSSQLPGLKLTLKLVFDLPVRSSTDGRSDGGKGPVVDLILINESTDATIARRRFRLFFNKTRDIFGGILDRTLQL